MSSPSAGRFALVAFPESGYYVLRQSHGTLIADFGAPGDFPNPAHQHAGIFSFELSSGGRRIIVDSGTPTYGAGQERLQIRGTQAHNTIRVDETDQFEVWKSFRVGRRSYVSEVATKAGEPMAYVLALHNGYAHLGVRHRRAIVSLRDAGWLIIDELEGSGRHRIESFLHLHPQVSPDPSGTRTALEPLGWTIAAIAGPGFHPRAYLYSPRIGERQPAQALVACEDLRLPCRRLYWVCPAPPPQIEYSLTEESGLLLETGGARFSLRLAPRPALLEASLNESC